MKLINILVLVTVLFGVLAAAVCGEEVYKERWNYMGGSILTAESTLKMVEIIRKSAEVGCTHVLWAGSRGPRIPELNDRQRAQAEFVMDEAQRLGVKIIPSIFSIGYSGRYFHFDSNLAAGVPVKGMPFVVKGTSALPDPALALNADRLKKDGDGLTAAYDVPRFMYYRVNYIMTRKPEDREEMFQVTSSNGKRWNSRTNPTVKEQDGVFLVETVFNTLEADAIKVRINAYGGDVRGVKIEPAGMLLILRRERIPLTVTNEDGTFHYEEGVDFEPVSDPVVAVRPFPGEFPLDHPAPAIRLKEGTRIRDGERILVSFWHHVRIYDDQDVITMEDPAVWDILELEVKEVMNLWHPEGLMLNYDEIRVAGWEGMEGTPGQMLAAHFKRACELARKYAPDATLYTWSDMFTPYHNARPFEEKGYYYLVNGNWDGGWEGLAPEVVIMNWYSPDERTIKFFADRGHKQVLCGYYDVMTTDRIKENIAKWKNVAGDLPGILGFMYTTWRSNYTYLDDFFELLDKYDSWHEQPLE